MQNILIVHGWIHSAKRYQRLKKDLERLGAYHVELYEFPGFGDTPARYKRDILSGYVAEMRRYLNEHDFDGIVAHSMGGNVVLRAILGKDGVRRKPALVLLSPVYQGVGILKPLMLFYPLLFPGMWLLQRPFAGCRLLVKLASLFTVNSWADIDERIVVDARRADTMVAVRTLWELTFDCWRVAKNKGMKGNMTEKIPPCQVTLVWGKKDRVITKRSMALLVGDLGGCDVRVFPEMGHTMVVEDYDELLKLFQKGVACRKRFSGASDGDACRTDYKSKNSSKNERTK